MTDHTTTAASRNAALGGFGAMILKRVLAALEGMGEAKIEKTVVSNLQKNGKGLPASASDADKAQFVRHATRQFFHAVPVVGHAVADAGRDFFTPRISSAVVPQLVAGTDTAKGAHIVGTALLADINSLAGV